ncbi:TlpA family protein disulfide reductase [Halopseudomonas xiamenensis]|uniref:TlpA family protein disulfide reductase n=1 Tax=Halopseudomonas xiamenensis TaxID=157792 RepID=UPI00162A86E2|nr:TlpA disulfide reductase family protein [Halopseudomonas xiamenensis]
MKAWFCGGMLAVILALGGCSEQQWLDHQGNSLSHADLQDQWVVVNYWAEWCAPCLHELPEFNRLAERPEVTVLGVNYDGVSGDALLALAQKMDIQFAVMGQDFADSLGLERPQVLPTTYVFNPQGELQHSLPGPQTERSLLVLLE